MGIHTADAIVLRRYPFRETSVTLSCLTDRFGKLKGLVKGLYAQPNRYRSAMEPFTINRIVFYDTRMSQLHLISQCDLLSPLTGLQRDVEIMRAASFCVELIDTIVPLEEPQPATYRLLKQTLERLALAREDPVVARLHFTVRLLRLAGFQPQLDECTGCGATIRTTGYWSARQGGLLCPSCLHEDPTVEPASPEMLNALAALAEAAQPLRLDGPLAAVLSRRLDEFLRWRLDRPLKTLTL
ncbi:MAG: DNA repair protein RecO [Candidatus Omnitrophica bacterium]|nr:DNA repair protein RecO [Candidatus Omnitrophota bacterium]MBI2495915.1 DNA repair protein RecO [Candidatus Omnitrophota bacterium]MBI3021291.1 DNA repair protein RecO [Candidatus Omnitrophota bacterium]